MSLYLANQHREVLDNVSLLAIDDTLTLINGSKDYAFPEFAQALRDGIPAISSQYGQVASIASAEYYDLSRSEAEKLTGLTYSVYNASDNAYDAALMAKTIDSNVNYGINKLFYGDIGFDTFTSLLTGGVNKNVFDYSRSNIIGNTGGDTAFQKYRRVPKSTACSWCKFKAVIIDDGNDEATISDDGFHNNCHCVIGVSFENETETKFRQAFYGDYKQQFNEAKTLIDEGKTTGSRSLQKGTEEYGAVLQKDITAASRTARKANSNYNKMSPEEKTKYRTNLENKSAAIADKINKGIPLSDLDKNILKGWGYEIPETVSTPLTSGNTKDILSVMRKEFGYR